MLNDRLELILSLRRFLYEHPFCKNRTGYKYPKRDTIKEKNNLKRPHAFHKLYFIFTS